jgi:hypothetical protein
LHDHGGGDHRHSFICEYTAGRSDGRCLNTMAWFPSTSSHDTELSGRTIQPAG